MSTPLGNSTLIGCILLKDYDWAGLIRLLTESHYKTEKLSVHESTINRTDKHYFSRLADFFLKSLSFQ